MNIIDTIPVFLQNFVSFFCACISHFEATEAKMLRVSVSSFFDYLTVSLRCYQEFDTSLAFPASRENLPVG